MVKKIAIFFDTNKLEARFSNQKCGDLCIADIKASNDFYAIRRFVEEYRLSDKIEFCIPEIVIREYKRHLLEIYQKHTVSFIEQLNDYKRVFGSILNVSYEFTKQNEAIFQEHIETLFDEFIIRNSCRIVNYDRNIDLFERLVDKAINKKAPFISARSNKKEYHDAGLKDAIIAETILKYHSDNGCPCILVSEDNDWGRCDDLVRDDIFVCKNCEHLKSVLVRFFDVSKGESIRLKFEEPYLRETIIRETGNQYDGSVSSFNVVEITHKDADVYIVNIDCNINETLYQIVCEYDDASNDVSNISYKIENE